VNIKKKGPTKKNHQPTIKRKIMNQKEGKKVMNKSLGLKHNEKLRV